jgi:hypothetical protein
MKTKTVVISGIGLLALVLVGAALFGGWLLKGQGLAAWSPSELISALSGGHPSVQFHPDMQPAAELPLTPADVQGLFDHRQNDSIFIGTGKENVTVKPGPGGDVVAGTFHDGPTVEVVVTPQTIIYDDVTFKQYNTLPSSGQKVQQVLVPGSLDDLGLASLVTVWGKQTGDRVIADVLVYLPPD